MSGLEGFSGVDHGPVSSTPEQIRAFQERMAEAARQLQAQQKQEQKQKKSEDQLIKILSEFIRSNQDQELAELLVRLLSYNLPAVFILTLIAIGYPDLAKLANLVAVRAAVEGELKAGNPLALQAQTFGLQEAKEFNYSLLTAEQKAEIDSWLSQISLIGRENRAKLTSWGHEIKVKQAISAASLFALQKYLVERNVYLEKTSLSKFTDFALQQICKSLSPEMLN